MNKILLLLTILFVGCGVVTPKLEAPPEAAKALLASTTPTTANFTWQWTQGLNTPDIVGFKLTIGTAPNTYSSTITIPDKAARSYSATGLDLSRINYAVLAAYTSFGIISAATPELAFGGQPSAPFQLGASPGN